MDEPKLMLTSVTALVPAPTIRSRCVVTTSTLDGWRVPDRRVPCLPESGHPGEVFVAHGVFEWLVVHVPFQLGDGVRTQATNFVAESTGHVRGQNNIGERVER